MTCILELNDSAITLFRDRQVLRRAPGVALVQNGDVLFGEAALRQSRVHPRQVNQQYFSRLSAEALPAPGKRARNHADLVYLHLCELKDDIDREGAGAVLLAAPGVLSPDQLGVLLGVLQEVGIAAHGFVDAAVAAMSTRPLHPDAYHLDVMWQRAVVTSVTVNGEVAKSAAQEIPDCGISRLLEGWINVIADRFVRETRFDPLHAAATEQQLFDQLYAWVDGAATGELTIDIRHGDHNPRVEVGRAALEDKAADRLRRIADSVPRGAHVYLSARAARLPGMGRALAHLGVTVEALAEDALPDGCLRHLDRIVARDGELRLVTRLPAASAEPGTAGPVAPGVEAAYPTHALLGHEAWPLAETGAPLPLRLERGRPVLVAADHVRLNGQTLADAQPLTCGDRVTAGEREYLIIAVHGHDRE